MSTRSNHKWYEHRWIVDGANITHSVLYVGCADCTARGEIIDITGDDVGWYRSQDNGLVEWWGDIERVSVLFPFEVVPPQFEEFINGLEI